MDPYVTQIALPLGIYANMTLQFAGMVGKFIEYPFDTVKVRLQSQPDHLPLQYKGPLDCFRQSFRADGFAGLYRGISAPLVGAAAENGSLFISENVGRELLYMSGISSREKGLGLGALFATGAFAGACTSLVLTPIELVKCRIQAPVADASGVVPKLRPLPVIRDIFRLEGFRGFWHGGMGTLIRESGGSSAWFGVKETVTAMFQHLRAKKATSLEAKAALAGTPLPLWQQAVAGASAGISYNFLFFPADTIKSRMQTLPPPPPGVNRTFLSEGMSIWRQHGVQGLYRGCGITCFRAGPASALIFIVFDSLKNNFPMH